MISWVVSIVELIAKYQACKKNRWNFVLNSIACGIWTYIFIMDKRYGALLCITVFMILNIIGWIEWTKDLNEMKLNFTEKCPICGKEFGTYKKFAIHMEKKHGLYTADRVSIKLKNEKDED